MGRPLGSKNLRATSIETTSGNIPLIVVGKENVHYDEVLGIRCLRSGRFKGLWELVRLNDNGTVKQVLTDANSRGMIITMITRQILKIVVQG